MNLPQESKIAKPKNIVELFTNFGVKNIGKKIKLELEMDNFIGTIVKSEYDSLSVQTYAGNVIQITSRDIGIFYIIDDKKTKFKYSLPEKILADAFSENSQYLICIIKNPDTEERILVEGKLSYEVRNGKRVLGIKPKNGLLHLIDLDFVDADIFLTDVADDLAHFIPIYKRVEILDSNYSKRKELCNRMIDTMSFFDNPAFFEYFLDQTDTVKQLLQKMYSTGPNFEIIQTYIEFVSKNLGTNFISLLLDPGMIAHFDDFMVFIKSLDGHNSPYEIRVKFSEYLGTEVVYMAMMLTEDEFKDVTQNGIYSRFLLNLNRTKVLEEIFNEYGSYLSLRFSTDFSTEIKNRINKNISNESSTSISVSSYEVVAKSVGYHSYRGSKNNKILYTFKCIIPKISLIAMNGLFDTEKRSHSVLKVGDLVVNESRDLNVEKFVPFIIRKEWVSEVVRIDNVPPMWERK